jgi:hypothetical protein
MKSDIWACECGSAEVVLDSLAVSTDYYVRCKKCGLTTELHKIAKHAITAWNVKETKPLTGYKSGGEAAEMLYGIY